MKTYFMITISGLLLCSALQGSLVAIKDSSGTNKFLGEAVSTCSTSAHGCNKGDVTTSTMYVDQRQTLDGFLGCNFIQHKNRVMYFFNEFGYWSAEREQFMNKLASSSVYSSNTTNDLGLAEVDGIGLLREQMQSKFPGGGVYTVAISAVPAFVDRVGKNVPCKVGETKIAAILFYGNGVGFQPLSASCIAVRVSDRFSLNISSQNSGAVDLPAGATAFSGVLTTSSSGSVNFQAKQIEVMLPPALIDSTEDDPKKLESSSDSSATPPVADIVPSISFGAALNLGASPQSISLKKGS